jgi:hypothetical protein
MIASCYLVKAESWGLLFVMATRTKPLGRPETYSARRKIKRANVRAAVWQIGLPNLT